MLVNHLAPVRHLAFTALLLMAGFIAPCVAHEGPSALVQLASVKSHRMKDAVTAYGHVLPDPNRVAGITLPRAGLIGHVWVSSGQHVTAGQRLLELDTAPQGFMAYQQAQAAVEYARSQVQRVQELMKEQMATRQQLDDAKHALHDAEARLQAQRRLGTGRTKETLRAPFDGVVTQVSVDQGQRVQADTTALLLAPRDALLVPLGVEQEVASRIRPGDSVTLTGVFRDHLNIQSTVAEVHAMVNPKTRLVDVLTRIPKALAGDLVLNEYMQGVITLHMEQALAVPRSAVLRDQQGSYVFVVSDGHAHRVDVEVGIREGDLVAIRGPIKQNAKVVVVGNYELQDGMAVREEKP